MDYNYKAIDAEVGMNANSNATQERMNTANNQNKLDQIQTTALYSQAATGQLTDDAKKETIASINSKFKDTIGGDMVSKIGGKYVINGGYGGAIARYLMAATGDPEATAELMYQLFGTPKEDTKVALSKTNAYDWEDDYNPEDYK